MVLKVRIVLKSKIMIKKEMLISEIIEKYPELAETLVEKYGLHCIGCMAAAMESLEDGASAHGMNQREIDKMISELNGLIKLKS